MHDPNHTIQSHAKSPSRPEHVWLLLALLVLFLFHSQFVSGLGFYIDDWMWLTRNNLNYVPGDGYFIRPVEDLYMWLVKSYLSNRPSVAHSVLAALNLFSNILLIVTLRRLGAPLALAVGVGFTFGVSPQYSTNRFMVNMGIQSISLICLLASVNLLIRAHQQCRFAWKVLLISLASATTLASALTYEIWLPLLPLAYLIAAWPDSATKTVQRSILVSRLYSTLGALIPSIVLIALYKSALATNRLGNAGLEHLTFNPSFPINPHLYFYLSVVKRGALIHFGSYGLLLPLTISKLCAQTSALQVVLSVLLGAFATGLVYRTIKAEDLSDKFAKTFLMFGSFSFLLCYTPCLLTYNYGMSVTGLEDRHQAAPALASILFETGLMIALCRLLERHRLAVFSILLGVVCGLNSFLSFSISDYWKQSHSVQTQLLNSVKKKVPEIRPDQVLLIDGDFSNVGPAPALPSVYKRNLENALRATYQSANFQAVSLRPLENVEMSPQHLRIYEGRRTFREFPWSNVWLVAPVNEGLEPRTVDCSILKEYLRKHRGSQHSESEDSILGVPIHVPLTRIYQR